MTPCLFHTAKHVSLRSFMFNYRSLDGLSYDWLEKGIAYLKILLGGKRHHQDLVTLKRALEPNRRHDIITCCILITGYAGECGIPVE